MGQTNEYVYYTSSWKLYLDEKGRQNTVRKYSELLNNTNICWDADMNLTLDLEREIQAELENSREYFGQKKWYEISNIDGNA